MARELEVSGLGAGAWPNVGLMLGVLADALVNSAAIMLLHERVLDNPFGVLSFFAFIAPVISCAVVVITHFLLRKGFHILALAAFVILMILSGMLNFLFLVQASAAV